MEDLDLGQTVRGFSPGQQVFSRFTLQRVLGRGGMGVVWLARDDELERSVALKFLPEIVTLDRESVTELKRETRRNLELTHPHIVRIYDFVQDTKSAAISMEFIDGSSLSAAKVDRPGGIFPQADVVRWATQLCSALSYAHGRARVVHRDLKPANLMISATGELKVTDFGIACSIADSVSRVSKNIGSSGTPLYMSPQQMMGERPTPADDIYAVGATLFELLAGKPPFYTGNIILQVQGKVPTTIAARREELGAAGVEPVLPEWESAIASCLEKDPAKRPASVAELAQRLGLVGNFTPAAPVAVAAPASAPVKASAPEAARALATPPAVPRPAPAPAPAQPKPPRRVGRWVAVGVVGLVVAAALGIWLGDVPNRWQASQQMEAARLALGRGEWLPAFASFKEARRLRPTDEAHRREFDSAQNRWLSDLYAEIGRAEPRVAYDRLLAVAATAELLEGSYAQDYRDLVASRRSTVERIVTDAARVARARAAAGDFAQALNALEAVRAHGALLADFAAAEQEVRLARLRAAFAAAQEFSLNREFDAGYAALEAVRADAGMLGEEFAAATKMVHELRVADGLDQVLNAQPADSAAFTRAFATVEELRKVGVLPEEIDSTVGKLRRRAEEFSIERLTRALRAGQAAEADAAIADYARFTDSQFTVTGSALLATKDLRAFVAALENLRMRPAAGTARTHARDIALIAATRARFSDPTVVSAFLREEFIAWSLVEEAKGHRGLALYLLEEARREGATVDAAREQMLRAALPGDVGLKLAFPATQADSSVGAALRGEPVKVLRADLTRLVGHLFPVVDQEGPGIISVRTTLQGPKTADDPKRERRTVRYQSGTRQVDNARYGQLQSELRSAQEDMRRAEQARYAAEAEGKRQAANTTDPNAALGVALAAGIAVGVHANAYNKASNRAANIRNELQNTPRTLTQAVYADEPYDVITHNMTYSADLLVKAGDAPATWLRQAKVTHQTVEITGNKDRGVPVQAPTYPAAAALQGQLGGLLAAQVKQPAAFQPILADATMRAVTARSAAAKLSPLVAANQQWSLVLMWRTLLPGVEGQDKAEAALRSALGLPAR